MLDKMKRNEYTISIASRNEKNRGEKMRIWLREARERSNLTMKEVADALHISESYYCSIENGTRQKRMDLSLAYKLSFILGIAMKTILDEEAEEQ